MMQCVATTLPWRFSVLFYARPDWSNQSRCILVCIGHRDISFTDGGFLSSVHIVGVSDSCQITTRLQRSYLSENIETVQVVDWGWPQWKGDQYFVKRFGKIRHWFGIFAWCLERPTGNNRIRVFYLFGVGHLRLGRSGIFDLFCATSRYASALHLLLKIGSI